MPYVAQLFDKHHQVGKLVRDLQVAKLDADRQVLNRTHHRDTLGLSEAAAS